MIISPKTPTVYITRDLERALGLDLNTQGYFIISNFTPFAKGVAQGRKNVLLIKAKPRTDHGSGTGEKRLLDTWELLQLMVHPERSEGSFEVYIGGKKINFSKYKKQWFKRLLTPRASSGVRNEQILVFKNTLQIEKTCKENNWKLLNPPAELSNKVEEKISQIKWLGSLKKYLPDYKITKCKNIVWNCNPCKHYHPCQPFILQFNRSHTGSGTILIKNQKQLQEIQNKFPEREVRIAEYIPGPLFTNNNVVTKNKIMLGNISYQITGLKPFTNLPFSTIGNDWALPHKYLSKKQITQYKKIATDVGKKLQKDGWRGLFGIDVVVDEKTGRLYLLEINCRQSASTTYESQLQNGTLNMEHKTNKEREKMLHDPCSMIHGITVFEAHLLALQNIDLKKYNLIEIRDGAQVILRNKKTKKQKSKKAMKKLLKNNFKVIEYNNTEPNSDLLRIQSKAGIMEKHNKFNKIGRTIINLLTWIQPFNTTNHSTP